MGDTEVMLTRVVNGEGMVNMVGAVTEGWSVIG